MNLNQIKTLKELVLYTPLLLELHEKLDGKWEPEMNSHEFLIELINRFDRSWYFGEIVGGKLAYFATVTKQKDEKALFWLLFVNPEFRSETKILWEELKALLKSFGLSTIYTQSTRTASSYERWMKKLGAQRVAIIYKFSI